MERLARHSPFTGDTSSDRVSLWPLLRTDDDGASIAWPLFDVDSRGFALRPIVAADGSDWEVLFPWSHHDGKTGEGWALPAYWSKNVVGFFPLFHLGAFSFVGPFYWRSSAGRVQWGGVFPLALIGDFNHVGPVWWDNTNSNWGVFPLVGVGELMHVGPVWWRDAPDPAWGLFPLVWRGREGDDLGLLPFYAHTLRPERRMWLYASGAAGSLERGSRRQAWIAPLYYRDVRPDERGDERDEVLLPLYYRRERAGVSHVFTLLGHRSVRDDGSSFSVYPLWWSARSGDESMRMLLPLFYYGEDGAERSLLTPLGGRGWSADGATRYVNVLGPIFHRSASADGERERTAVLWPLFETSREGEERTTRSLPFYSSTSSGERGEGWYALGLGHFLKAPSESAHRLWPFYSSSAGSNPKSWLYETTLYGSRVVGELHKRWLFPLFASESARGRTQRDFLLGLGSYSRQGDEANWRIVPIAARSEFATDGDWLDYFTLFGSRRRPGQSERHFLSPLVYRRTRETSATREAQSQRVLTLAYFSNERSRDLVVPSAAGASATSRLEHRETSLCLGLFTSEFERFVVWRDGVLSKDEAAVLARFSPHFDSIRGFERDEDAARAILARHGHEPHGDGLLPLRDALGEFVAQSAEQVSRRAVNVPLVFDYERDADSLEWSGPLKLIHSRRTSDSSKFSLLYYGFRSVTRGRATRRDIFPFITWDSSPSSSEATFLWRLLRYKREGDRSGGHFLFVPWGDV